MNTFTVHIGYVGGFKNARQRTVTVQTETWQDAKSQVEATLDLAFLRVVEVSEGEPFKGPTVWEVDK